MIFQFRTPTKCHNGHFRWYYYGVRFGCVINPSWGPRPCDCPTHELSEGFGPVGDDQRFTGLVDRKGNSIYEGDYIQRFPESKYLVHDVSFTPDEGFGLAEHMQEDVEVVGNVYESAAHPPHEEGEG